MIDRYGIPPELIPDFYGLKGDTSDNIPGVPGIGDKTAAQLLQQFGDLEGVLASVDEISGAKRKENLTNHADDARISKQLATVDPRRPGRASTSTSCSRAEPDRSRLREIFREFELRDPLRRLEEALGEGDAAAPRAARRRDEGSTREGPRGAASALDGIDGEHAALGRRTAPEAPPRTQLPGLERRRTAALRRLCGRRRGARRRGRDARGVVAALGRPAADGARLEDARRRPRSRCAAPPLEHDTMVAAYLLDPAAARLPARRAAPSERGLGAASRRPRSESRGSRRAGRARPARSPSASARRSRSSA